MRSFYYYTKSLRSQYGVVLLFLIFIPLLTFQGTLFLPESGTFQVEMNVSPGESVIKDRRVPVKLGLRSPL